MPELPEVETVRRGLAPALVGAQFSAVEQRRADLRFPFPKDFPARLTGRTVTALRRRAKYLLVDLDNGETLVMHLGMSGSFRIEDDAGENTPGLFHNSRGKDAAHDHVVFHLSNGKRITYNDPRRFGFMLLVKSDLLAAHPLFRDVGLEPLSEALNGTALTQLFSGKKAPLKAALLDQRLIAGLGNIYVSEALHRAGLSPRRTAGSIARKNGAASPRAELLAKAIREVLEEAVKAGGSSLRDHRQTNGDLGYFQHNFRVYDRAGAPCPRPGCGGTIKRIVQSGRATYYCPTCQK
ncbi:DNA-formamidopyrimidine glycosylase [Methylovirgula ligni]|uniref:Formamidopyrimidine-DNA glycosylase n=1 Tax=Methylovirgula ligni TaxID=569860 RepID=A0A3D9YXR2_9HYPH|nr:bifunctional DNA-formamidopyrimidine glycosylase/DNA-(apurinic or apyrimidinic site) lyase [Methylovirgula ligni]QAY94681.1 DNA-formamidopyrimidine glycosylase [Methylovirgula ligni]REF87437.1 DNA-(apurinic or apyrimidinic site) lyase [Methylovirgula ligni]